jgi:hypothetical protein
MRFGYSSFDHRVRLRLACAVGLACSLSNTRVSRAEDTPVDEAPAPTRTSQPQQRSDTERPQAMPVEAVADQDYSDLLTVSYVVGPLLGFGMTLGLVYLNSGELTFGNLLVGLLGAGLAPALVHWFHDQTMRGFRAFFALPSLTAAATVVVAVAAYGVFALTGAFPPSEEDGTLERWIIAGVIGLIGGGVAAVVWAVFDVQDSAVPSHTRSRAARPSSFQFAMFPTEHGVSGVLRCKF